MRNSRDEPYNPTWCERCHQLQWNDFIGKPCQFCGHLTFTQLRPVPTFSQIDKRTLKKLDIPDKEPK